MLTEAFFVKAENWEQCKCPYINRQINKLWYIHTMDYYSAVKGMM